MATRNSDERFCSVKLSVTGIAYISEIWKSSSDCWVLLSVHPESLLLPTEVQLSFPSLEQALWASESIAASLIVSSDNNSQDMQSARS